MKIAACFAAILTIFAMSMNSVSVYAEDNGVTRSEAGQYAFEMLQMFDYSSQVEMFGGDVDGTWYALYDWLANAIYEDPAVYYEWYMAWLSGVDDYSDVFLPEAGGAIINGINGGDSNSKTAEQCIVRGKTGIIAIKAFTDDTDEQFIKAYESARKSGVTSVIIDLRGNGGGVVESAYNILNHIIPEQIPLYTTVEKERTTVAFSEGQGSLSQKWNPDLLILTDKNTASAAEIITAVLRFNGYARVIGEQSYGKGVGEYYIRLTIGDYLAVTAQRFFLPDGSTWHGTGFTPDAVKTDDVKTGADEVLEYALTVADGIGNMDRETDNDSFAVTVNLSDIDSIGDTRIETLATFASVMRQRLDKPLRFTYKSSNGVRLIVDANKAFEAAHDEYAFGIYGSQSETAGKILKDGGRVDENAVVLVTVQSGEYGFSPTVAVDTETAAEYFYYYDSVNDSFTEFLPAHDYDNGVLRFNIKRGGIIVASESAIE
jgi:hypothetical protein